MNPIQLLAAAILERETYGQLSPQTIKNLKGLK